MARGSLWSGQDSMRFDDSRISLDIKCLRISSSGWKIRSGYVTTSQFFFSRVRRLMLCDNKGEVMFIFFSEELDYFFNWKCCCLRFINPKFLRKSFSYRIFFISFLNTKEFERVSNNKILWIMDTEFSYYFLSKIYILIFLKNYK